MPVEGDDTRARCRYCRILLRAHNSDLRNHARTSRHATNVAFGRPCDDPLVRQSASKAKNMGLASTDRRKLGYGRDWRYTESGVNALDWPDESLASLSRINTLISFGWNSPVTPEKTFVLLNDLPIDEQLISSLPDTAGIRFRVKKDTVATGSESGGTVSSNVRENRLVENPQQIQNDDKELSSETLAHVARSLTLWEFMMLKLGRGRANAEQAKVAEILTEFSELQTKVKAVSHSMLIQATASLDAEEADTSKHIMLDSQELANCLGLQTGLYYIKPAELNKATEINCRSLIPPMRRRLRTKRSSGMNRYLKSDDPFTVDSETEKTLSGNRQYVIESADSSGEPRYMIHPDLLDPSSSVIVQGLDGATAGHLVLVSENGELLLQCDAKDFPQLSNNDARQIVEPSSDEVGCERADTLYVAEDDHTDLA